MILRTISVLLIIWMIGFAWFAIDLPRPAADDARTDSIVVLTAGASRSDRPLLLSGPEKADYLLIFGVGRAVKPHEVVVEYTRPDGRFECCIRLGSQAAATRSPALETARGAARRKDTPWRL